MTNITKIDKKKSIRQSNNLIEARYKLTGQEQKLVIAICSQLDKNASCFNTVRIKVADFADFCEIKGNNRYSEVKRIVMRLLDRKLLIYNNDGGWYGTHWLQSAKYIPSESIIEYTIDEKLRPELLKLKSAYLDTSAQPLMKFRHDYSVRLYFILKKLLKIREFDYELDFFRDRFRLSKSYQLFANLKNKILEPSLKEINEKSDINVDYSYIKSGRSYTKIHFIVTIKNREIEARDNIKKSENADEKLVHEHTEEENDIITRLMKYDISSEHAERFLKKFGVEHIDRNLKYACKNKKNKFNMAGWIIKCINDDLATVSEKTAQMYREEREREKQKQYERMHSRTHPIFDKIPDKTDWKTAENSERKNSELQYFSEILDPDFLKYLPENMRKNKNKE